MLVRSLATFPRRRCRGGDFHINARESEEQYHRFVITADDSLRAERAALAQDVDVIGYYHSPPITRPFHLNLIPNMRCRFTPISSWRSRSARRALTSWRLTQDRQRFLQEDVQIVL
ncbi:MAG: hypothetical protein ACLR17_03465 [Enterobacteriaceae bacterium]